VLIILTNLILGLGLILGLFLKTNNEPTTYILGGLFIAFGIIIWIAANRKFKKDSEKYKVLITEIFGL
jgi:putative Ca2+/H+ antiporter (TMEM165/GDT1 family)